MGKKRVKAVPRDAVGFAWHLKIYLGLIFLLYFPKMVIAENHNFLLSMHAATLAKFVFIFATEVGLGSPKVVAFFSHFFTCPRKAIFDYSALKCW